MPLALVTVKRNCSALPEEGFHRFGALLQGDVAQCLTCTDEGGSLVPDDIEVRIDYYDPERHINSQQYDVQVIVLANDFPSRRESLDDRCQLLREKVKLHLRESARGFVWIRLAPAAFAEF